MDRLNMGLVILVVIASFGVSKSLQLIGVYVGTRLFGRGQVSPIKITLISWMGMFGASLAIFPVVAALRLFALEDNWYAAFAVTGTIAYSAVGMFQLIGHTVSGTFVKKVRQAAQDQKVPF